MNLIKSYLCEIANPTATGQQKYLVGDISQLRSAPILGVEFYDVADITKSYSGNDIAAMADLQKAYLVLYFDGGEYITVPVYQLVRVKNNAAAGHPYSEFMDQIAGHVVDWSKSYVWFGTAPATTGRQIMFNIYYKDK